MLEQTQNRWVEDGRVSALVLLHAQIVTCGITPHPPHAKLEKTACRSTENVPNRHFQHTEEAVRALKEQGYAVYAMETTSRSEVYTNVAFPQPVRRACGYRVGLV
jgi:tRNA G18 (ribose-2'-O)-methylase SpoU